MLLIAVESVWLANLIQQFSTITRIGTPKSPLPVGSI